MVGSTPDAGSPEVQRLEAQAHALRQQFARTREDLSEIVLKQRAATRAAENAKADATEHAEWAAASRKAATQQLDEAQRLDTQAAAAEAEGRKHDAEELRERAADEMAKARQNTSIAGRETELSDQARVAENRANAEHEALTQQRNAFSPRHEAAEKAIDAIEDKARNLRMADVAQGEVDDLKRQAADLRASGDEAGAAGLASAIRDAEVWRDSMRAEANAIVVDEAALTAAGLDPAAAPEPEPAQASDATTASEDSSLGLDGDGQPAPAPGEQDVAMTDVTGSDTGSDIGSDIGSGTVSDAAADPGADAGSGTVDDPFAPESGADQSASLTPDPALDPSMAADTSSFVETSDDHYADYSAGQETSDDFTSSDYVASDDGLA